MIYNKCSSRICNLKVATCQHFLSFISTFCRCIRNVQLCYTPYKRLFQATQLCNFDIWCSLDSTMEPHYYLVVFSGPTNIYHEMKTSIFHRPSFWFGLLEGICICGTVLLSEPKLRIYSRIGFQFTKQTEGIWVLNRKYFFDREILKKQTRLSNQQWSSNQTDPTIFRFVHLSFPVWFWKILQKLTSLWIS